MSTETKLHDMLYRLYADYEYMVIQDSWHGEASDEDVATLTDWVYELIEEGVLFDDREKIALGVLRTLGVDVEEGSDD